MIELKYLVTGLPKGATTYMCRLLTSLDIMCGHESIFKTQGLEHAKKIINGEIQPTTSYCSLVDLKTNKKRNFEFDSKKIIAESSYMSAPYLNDPILKNTKIIFVVRDPWNTLTSLFLCAHMWNRPIKESKPYIDFCEKIIPNMNHIENLLNKCVHFMIKWHEIIEKQLKENKDYIIFKSEEKINNELLDFLKKEKNNKKCFENTKENSWRKGNEIPIKKRQLTNEHASEFEKICKKYDYPLDNTENNKKIFFL